MEGIMRFLIVSLVLVSFSIAQQVLVNLPQGQVAGYHVDYGNDTDQLFYGSADVFLGIPYVQPPIGNLRFQKPQELCQFPGPAPYNATFYRPACPQSGSYPMSEDCLYLNVFTPSVKPDVKYPVMLWIHGGSLKGGSAMDYQPKGAIRNLVSRGVVVVTIQYRLGLLGFFTTHSPDFPPNLGLLDQVEAIRWVSNNIVKFGGDPYRITLFGQSAGGCSVSAHTYSPLSQNLFHGAIMESGVVWTCYEGALSFTNHSFNRAQALCNTTFQQWTSNDFDSLKTCMMNTDYRKWLPMDDGMNELFGWRMSQDNYFLPDVPRNLAKYRKNIPVMLGSNLNEYSLFDLSLLAEQATTLDTYTRQFFEANLAMVGSSFGNETDQITKIMENTYAAPEIKDDDHIEWLKANDRALTCGGFTGFIGRDIDSWLEFGNQNVYLYEYTHPSNVSFVTYHVPGWDPVPHAAEIPFIWMPEYMWTAGLATDVDFALLDWFGETWTNFAKFGFPFLDKFWTPVQGRRQLNYVSIGEATFAMLPDYRQTDQVVWNRVNPALTGILPPDVPDYNNGTNRIPGFVSLPASQCNYTAYSTLKPSISTFSTSFALPTFSTISSWFNTTTTTTTTIATTTSFSISPSYLFFPLVIVISRCFFIE
ncbi:unnamed protein product [Caenorhabditis auriculariae]|uniref:Carboxylic ester hydrolase n=1 Tax=Caenorhabditis auriculariae TaxID=2777116 RepID=A0A8S1HB54_9PELO|nr:unnamed protein product [Caenorhabditis auriculariae]